MRRRTKPCSRRFVPAAAAILVALACSRGGQPAPAGDRSGTAAIDIVPLPPPVRADAGAADGPSADPPTATAPDAGPPLDAGDVPAPGPEAGGADAPAGLDTADTAAMPDTPAAPVDAAEGGDAPDPVAEAICEALEPTFPEAVELVARAEHDGVTFALYQVYPGAIWEARESDAGTLETSQQAWQARIRRCEDETRGAAPLPCEVTTAPNVHVGWDRAGRGSSLMSFAWEVARLARDAGDPGGPYRIVRRATLVSISDQSEATPELRVRDLDGDGRVELTVLVGVAVPAVRFDDEHTGVLGWILDGEDLRSQYAAVRSYRSPEADQYVTIAEQTTWRLLDLDDDGRKDLQVRTEGTLDELGEDEDYAAVEGHETYQRRHACLYDVAGDLWVCEPPLRPEDQPLRRAAVAAQVTFLEPRSRHPA
ncbi:MAG: hypothetical protein JXB32_25075 [Deltaproteobacteria bacterium]|nr:hypothetical protein [Deltaproteobacteria bacterium]